MDSNATRDTSHLPELLRSQGFNVEPTGDIDGVYIVSKGGKEAILDLTTYEDSEDSMRTIDATFNGQEAETDELGELEPMPPQTMNNRQNSTTLPQRVASIGESDDLAVEATLTGGGKTTHAHVSVDTTSADLGEHHVVVGAQRLNIADFFAGDGPLEMADGQTLVNADEIRQLVASRVSK